MNEWNESEKKRKKIAGSGKEGLWMDRAHAEEGKNVNSF